MVATKADRSAPSWAAWSAAWSVCWKVDPTAPKSAVPWADWWGTLAATKAGWTVGQKAACSVR